jgi:hypothetical protein
MDGTVLPVEVKFRRKIDDADLQGLRAFIDRYSCPWGLMVTRDTHGTRGRDLQLVPLRDFLLAY